MYSYVAAEAGHGDSTVIEMLKYILITFVGPDVKPFHRARSTQHRVYLYNFAQPFLQLAGEMQAVHTAEVTETAIAQKLSGSRLEQHMDSSASSEKLTGGRTAASKGQDRVHFANHDAAIEAIKAIRLDSHLLRWIAWRYQPEVSEDPEALLEVSRGHGGYSEVEPLLKPGIVVFVLLALDTKSEGEYASTKYTLITWCSDGVKPMHKARSAQDRLQLVDIINQHLQLSAEWQATTLEEISEEKLLHKLQGSIIQETKTVSTEPRAKATINDGISKVNPDFKANTATVKVEWENAEQESLGTTAIQSLRDAKTNWALFGYAGNSNKISFLQQGHGDWTEVDALMDEKSVYYVVIGVAFGLGDYVQNKYIFINWVGVKAKPTLKARSSQHRAALYAFAGSIFPLAGEMQALAREDATSENIRKKLIGTTQLSEEQAQLTERASSPSPSGSGGASSGDSSSSGVEKFELVDAPAIEAALKKVKDDSNTTNWLSFKYTEDGNFKIQLDQEGHGGLSEIKPLLKDDTILYLVVGVVQTEVDYQSVKYLFVTFIGPNVKPLHKARSSQHRVKLYNHFGQFLQFAGELQILSADDLTEVSLVSKISGSRMVSAVQAKTTQRKATVTKGSMEKFSFADEQSALNALNALRKEGDNEWVVFGNPEGKPESVVVIATGKGQLDAVKAHFGDDQVRYAVIAFKVIEVVEDVDYTRAKNIFLSWCGPDVKPLAKARSSQQRVPIYEYCLKVLPLHGQIHAEKPSDLNVDDILEKFSGSRTQVADKIEKEAARLKELESAKTAAASSNDADNAKVDISTFFKEGEAVTALLKQMYVGQLNWIALGYKPDDETTVVLIESGNTGLEGFKPHLKDSHVLYIITAIKEDNRDAAHKADDHATLEGYATTKFIQINWVGKDVKPLQKARSSQHRVALATQLVGTSLQLSAEFPATHLEEITEVTLRDKITGSRVKA